MSRRSALAALQADWPAIDRLLDEALDRDPTERAAWLAALPPEQATLRPLLEKLLGPPAGSPRGPETADVLGTLSGLRLPTPPPAAAGTEAAAGDTIGPWRLVREIGAGGMGSVWLAERADGGLRRPVALKLPRLVWGRGLAERMARERDILATLEHPNIARLYDAGVDALGRPWLALEHVEGRPIDAFAHERALSVRQRVELLLQACDAVAYAHGRLVIHRDLKPSNILVDREGRVKLLDFGIAKLVQGDAPAAATALTELAGRAFTPAYASPEQRRGEPLGTASDVYSLGVVAYELLAGQRPPPDDGGPPRASARALDPSAAAALRGDLDAVLARALGEAPAQRYATVDALAQDLRRHLAGESISARPRGVLAGLWRRAWRHRVPLCIGAGSVLALGIGLGFGATALVLAVAAAGSALAAWLAQQAVQRRREAEAAARRAERVRDGLLEIFAPGHHPTDGRLAHQITLKEALDRARDRAASALADEPLDRAMLLDVLAGVYEQLDLADDNFALLDQALAAARAAPAGLESRALVLRLHQHRLVAAFVHQRFDGLEGALARYEAWLDGLPDEPGGARAALLYFRVRHERLQRGGDSGEAAERLLQAEALFAREAPADPIRQHALALLVQAAIAAGRLDDAERAAGTAIDLARRAPEGPAALANAFSVRGVLRLRRERWAEARDDLQAAQADYALHAGPEHVLTAQNAVFLGHARVGCGEIDAGLAQAREAAATISRLRGGEAKEAQTLTRLAAAELLAGEAAAAAQTARRAIAVWDGLAGLAPQLRAEAQALLEAAESARRPAGHGAA